MPGPHPLALRERVVEAWERGEGSFATLAKRFMIGEASVNRWVAQKRRSGHVEPKPMGGNRREPRVDKAGEAFLRDALHETSDSTLVELCAAYLEEFDVVVSPQTMSDTVRRMGFTRKRGSFVRELRSGPNS
jgi:transposase